MVLSSIIEALSNGQTVSTNLCIGIKAARQLGHGRAFCRAKSNSPRKRALELLGLKASEFFPTVYLALPPTAH